MGKVEAVIQQPIGKADKFNKLVELEKALNKRLGTTLSLIKLGDKVGIKMPSISTGMPTIDEELIGTGGIPRGRIIEIFGPESSGKTTFCLHLVAQEQRQYGGICAYIDAEHALDPSYAAKLGVDVDELIVSQPNCGEEALEIVEELINSDTVSLIIVDSVAALVPRAELEGDMGDSHMGLQARLMSQAMRKLTGKVDTHRVTVIFINQIREKIGVMFGSPETTTGGRALKFFSSVRLDIRRREAIMEGTELKGHKLEMKAVKNKVGTPLRKTEVRLLYDSGFDTVGNFIEYCKKIGVLEGDVWIKFKGKNIGHGAEATKENLNSDKELFAAVRAEVERVQKVTAEQGK